MWHVVPAERIGDLARTDRGLTVPEIFDRSSRYGQNEFLEDHRAGWISVVSDTLKDPMIWLLAATAMLFWWIGETVEAVVMAIALVPVFGMDAFLHRRTTASTEGLAGQLAARTRVLRDGTVIDIPAVDLVPGDLAVVSPDTSFPADGIIISGTNIQIDESALTGEAMPVRKQPVSAISVGAGQIRIEDMSWGSAGTRLLTGEARLRVVFTGAETLYGEIVRAVKLERQRQTPLQGAVNRLVTWLVVISVLACIALAMTRYAQGFGLLDAFVSAVTLAVAALPEEFPVAFTFFLGVGVYRLAQRKALVRRSVAVENIGRITCICSDKTGTITEGRLRVADLVAADGFTGTELHRIAAAASRQECGDPLDAALLRDAPRLDGSVVAAFPFTEDRRREVAILKTGKSAFRAAAKGAPETIFRKCELAKAAQSRWTGEVHRLASQGYKVIACAEKRLAASPASEPERGYRLAGLIAFEDPIRPEAREAVAQARKAGIRVIMVTGDHVTTATAVARAIRIGGDGPRVIEGVALKDHLQGPALSQFDVVARATPMQKLDLVRALKAAGEIVSVTGDGVNDVPALQGADIGIAMGERGTRPAREAAMIVLLDDSFRTIIHAIAEGRQLFWNLRLSFAYLLMAHIPLVTAAALIPFLGYPLVFLPVHVVWLELIMHPTAFLAFKAQAQSRGIGAAGDAGVRFFQPVEWLIICLVGLFVSAAVAGGYVHALGPDGDAEHARTLGIAILIAANAAVTAGLSGLATPAARWLAALSVLSLVVLAQLPWTALALRLTPLHFGDWLIAALAALFPGLLAALLSRHQPPLLPSR
jgi:Ca2+-transporting ATPase